MSKERRYQDHEVRQILDLAIDQEDRPAQSLPTGDGLTLVELQEIGREVGLPQERITQAVAEFEARGKALARGKFLGLPTSVGRVVPLPRSPTDREWEVIVAELRSTFGGKGTVTSHGSLREWTHDNGTLHAFLEPTGTGHRLRLTTSGLAVIGVLLGGVFSAFAVFILVVLLAKHAADYRLAIPAFFALLGGALSATSALSLPGWAREQERRMEHIASYTASLLAGHAQTDDPQSST